MDPLFQAIVDYVEPPKANPEGAFQMQISQLDYSSYVGVIGVGRIMRGNVRPNMPVTIISPDGSKRNGKIGQVQGYLGLQRSEVAEAYAGDIVAITGLGELKISDTVCCQTNVEALPPFSVDEPTVTMTFQVNTSPFAGKEGKFITSRNILERLQTELVHNVALRVETTKDPDKFKVSGRGELHLSILIENMRREGYELAVSRPEVILKIVDGQKFEPMENLTIGFETEFMTLTSGTGLIYHTFDSYGEWKGGTIGQRKNGVMISNASGKALGYAIWYLQDRGRMFIEHAQEVYEGQIIGIHNRDNDLTVNCLRGKKLTNVRASGTDEAIVLVPPVRMSLEQALEFINNDELVEVTPKSLRIRKKLLTELDRTKAFREAGGLRDQEQVDK